MVAPIDYYYIFRIASREGLGGGNGHGGGGAGAGGARRRLDDAAAILEAGIAAALPSAIIPRVTRGRSIVVGGSEVRTSRYSAVRVVSMGKAGLSMASAFDSRIRAEDGIVVVPGRASAPGRPESGAARPTRLAGIGKVRTRPSARSKFRVVRSTHPLPSAASVRAARSVLSYIGGCRKSDLLVFLVSGGSSALVALPDGVTLAEKVKTSEILLGCGANIAEINCVRKHISKVKGGGMVSRLPCDAVALLMSDVKANDMSAIASGTTYCDRTTFAQALAVVRKYRLQGRIPRGVVSRLESGARGRIPETPKRPVIRNFVIASNRDCLAAMRRRAEGLGYAARTTTVFGKVERQAAALARLAPTRPGSCVIFGGETTVLVRGGGSGGRNQEMVLRIAGGTRRDMIVGSVGTDGIDGNTRFAGAMARTSDIDRAEAGRYLKASNSSAYFARHGGLIETGPTQANLLDVGVMLR